jgi:AcrR family transcriptional regulator
MPPKTAAKRSYNSSRRALQAAQTRDEVLRAAVQLFATSGWAGTTLAAIANEAGVSVETIYNGFGSKKGLLEAARDFSIVGDSEPVPFVERPEFRQMGEGSFDDRVAHAAAVTADIHERSALVWQAIIEASSADEEINRHRLEQEEGRRAVLGQSLALVVGRAPDEPLLTMVWVLYSPEAYLKLVQDAGFTREEYVTYLIDATTRLFAGERVGRR